MKRLLRILGLAEYGGDELLIALLACGSAACALALWLNVWFALLPLVPFAVVLWFFRDPERQAPDLPQTLLAPADGTVSDVVEVDEPDYIQGRALRIGIFLSPFNVHVNRAPCACKVDFLRYKAGEFLPAYNKEAPHRNESASLGVQVPGGTRLVVKQITGVLARRIICEVRPSQSLAAGQRYGMIKFGSRTELYVPLGAAPEALVKVGDKVQGGLTPCCKYTPQPPSEERAETAGAELAERPEPKAAAPETATPENREGASTL